MQLKVLKKEKIRELYHRMFQLDEVIEFKEAMKKLQREGELYREPSSNVKEEVKQ